MSYILEALRKAERKRNLGQVPNLESPHAATVPAKQRRWAWLLGLILLANATLLATAYFWHPSEPATASLSQAMTPETDEAAPTTQTASTPARSAMDSSPNSTTYWEPESESAATPPLTVPVPSHTNAGFASMPSVQALPTEFRQTLPQINIDVHVYSEDPEKRFVLINSRPYREGDHLDEGPTLEMITEKGILMYHEGERFVIPVHQ